VKELEDMTIKANQLEEKLAIASKERDTALRKIDGWVERDRGAQKSSQ
jgi:hypothetical protein